MGIRRGGKPNEEFAVIQSACIAICSSSILGNDVDTLLGCEEFSGILAAFGLFKPDKENLVAGLGFVAHGVLINQF